MLTVVELKESYELSALHRIEYWTLLGSMYVVMLAAGHVKLVALGSTLVELVVVEERDVVIGVDVEATNGVVVIASMEVELGSLKVIEDVDLELLISGQETPGLQGSTEQQPLNPF